MLRGASRVLFAPPKMSATQAMFVVQKGGAAKLGGEEKFQQACLEYLYEPVHHTDPKKREADVVADRAVALAYDRMMSTADGNASARRERLLKRQIEALEAIPAELQEEATLLNSEAPITALRVTPTLSPPSVGYEPGFGLQVASLTVEQREYPPVQRPTDTIQRNYERHQQELKASGQETGDEGDETGGAFPFVAPEDVDTLAATGVAEMATVHGATRTELAATGAASEAWEAHVALQKKALARQQLILELHRDDDLAERYADDASLREEEWGKRGLLPLLAEEADPSAQLRPASAAGGRVVPPEPAPVHPAQLPKCEPIRSIK